MRKSERNMGNGNLLKGLWHRQKKQFYLDYIAFYELLDELTLKGMTPRQITEALERGIDGK